MNAPENILLPDVQAIADRRSPSIQRVGVKDVCHPLKTRPVRESVTTMLARLAAESGDLDPVRNVAPGGHDSRAI